MATDLNSYELNGVKDSIPDWISNISPDAFPFQSMIGKDKTTQPKFDWQTDSDEAVNEDNALMEGFDFADLDSTFAPTNMLTGYTQKMGKAVKVTGDADAQAAWGRSKESSYQMNKKARALKRDFEYALLNNGATAAEVKGESPRKLGGYLSMISSIDGGVTVTGDPLYGVSTLLQASGDKPTEDDIFAAMAALWATGGSPEVLMCSDTMKDVIGGMQESTPNRARIFENSTKFSKEVNTITDELGQTVKVVYNRNMPANTVYIFNADDWQIMMFRPPKTDPQGKSGDYMLSVLHMDAGLRHRNPWASAAIIPSQTPPNEAAKITSVTVGSLANGTVDTAYTETAAATLSASDDGTYTTVWSIDDDGTGLEIDADSGEITGTPTDAGGPTVTCTVTDSYGTTKTGTATITISAALADPKKK